MEFDLIDNNGFFYNIRLQFQLFDIVIYYYAVKTPLFPAVIIDINQLLLLSVADQSNL